MKDRTNRIILLGVTLWLALAATSTAEGPGPSDDGTTRIRSAIEQALPSLDGARLRVVAVEVTYPPGGSSPPHRHPCPVVGYVVKGAVRMQVGDGPVTTFRPGESFYEPPDAAHVVSANASGEEPATFVAFFVCDEEGPLSVPLTGDGSAEGRHP